jgi:hypothetical protein
MSTTTLEISCRISYEIAIKIISIALVLVCYCIAILEPLYCIDLKKLVLFMLRHSTLNILRS